MDEEKEATSTGIAKKPWYKKWWGIALIVLGFLIILPKSKSNQNQATKPVSQERQAESTQTQQEKTAGNETPPETHSLEQQIRGITNEKLGEKLANKDQARIRSVTVLKNEGPGYSEEQKKMRNALIELNADENVTGALTKSGILENIKDILEPISKLESDLSSIGFAFYLPLVDKYGNSTDTLVLNYVIEKSTWQQINWDNFDPEDFPSLVEGHEYESYYEHDVLKQ